MYKKIGILTYHHVVNPGAILQSYSVSQIFKATFSKDSIEIVDYRPLSTEIRDFKFGFLSFRTPGALLSRASRYLRFRSFVKKMLPLGKTRIITNKYEVITKHLKNRYDLLVVGSDEIWKIEKGKYVRPFPNIYFLADSLGAKQVSFAASANSLKFRDLSSTNREWLAQRLSHFDLISVRDQHTLDMMKFLKVDEKVTVFRVPDPTFYLEINEEVKQQTRQHLESLGVDFKKPLIGITFYDPRMPKSFFDAFKKQGYQVIALTVSHPMADVNLLGKLDPFQWACTYGFLNVCLTNLFHGTIFALKNCVPCLSLDYGMQSGYQTKLESLLKDFGLMERYIQVSDQTFQPGFLEDKIKDMVGHDKTELIKQGIALRKDEIKQYMKSVEGLVS